MESNRTFKTENSNENNIQKSDKMNNGRKYVNDPGDKENVPQNVPLKMPNISEDLNSLNGVSYFIFSLFFNKGPTFISSSS